MTHFEIDRIASLAYLELNAEEKETLNNSIKSVLEFVETIAALDVADVAPIVSVISVPTFLRSDEPRSGLSLEALEENCVKMADGSFVVPQVIKKQ